MASRREFIRLVMMATGATYSVSLGGCRKPSELRLLHQPIRTIASPHFNIAHTYLRDGGLIPSPDYIHRTDVIVVGGGFSGLSAAVTLEESGRSVVVVESEPVCGGTARSKMMAGGFAPLGSVYFVEQTPSLQRLLRRSAIQPVACPPDGYDFGNGEVVLDLWSDATLDRVIANDGERDGMKKFRDFVLNLDGELPSYPLSEVLPTEQQHLDVSAEDWVKSFRSQTLLTVLNAYSRSSMGALLSRTNVYCLLNFYSGEFGESFGGGRYTIPGGPGVLTKEIAASLPNVQPDHIAVRIQNSGKEVLVDCIESSGRVIRYVANHAIVAAPKYQARYLIPEMPAVQKEACSELSYAPYMTLHIISDVPLVKESVYDTWNLTSEFETDVVNPASVQGTTFEKNVCSLFLPMDRFARGQLQDPDLFARRAADVADRFLTTRTREQQDSVREIHCWGWGHGLVVPTPGSHSGIAQMARRPVGNIYFAGADNDAAPAIENAADSGAHVANLILQNSQTT